MTNELKPFLETMEIPLPKKQPYKTETIDIMVEIINESNKLIEKYLKENGLKDNYQQ